MADPALAGPDQRGRTVIKDKVLETIAARAARDVEGVAADGSDLTQLIGRALPRADAQVAGTRARVQVTIAVAWPQPVGQVAAHVRDTVRAALSEMTGLDVDAVDVQVAKVLHLSPTIRRRVQ